MEGTDRRRRPGRGLIIALMVFLVISGIGDALVVRAELRTGGMAPRWTFTAAGELYAYREWPVLIDNTGLIIVSESGGLGARFVALNPTNGTEEWAFRTAGFPSLVQGSDSCFYFVDWPGSMQLGMNSSNWGFRNLTSLDQHGAYRWSYMAENGSLDFWGVFPDGTAVVWRTVERYNATRMSWDHVKYEIEGVRGGERIWSLDPPIGIQWWNFYRVADNGTLQIRIQSDDGVTQYEAGISESGQLKYVINGHFYLGRRAPSSSTNAAGSIAYMLWQEYVDNETSAVTLRAVNMDNGSTVWETDLGTSTNPSHQLPPGMMYNFPVVDLQGRMYCHDVEEKYSYSLAENGTLLWKKPFIGAREVAGYPSGGFVATDGETFLERVDPNGRTAWRHYVSLDGYSTVLLGPDGTVYYNQGSSVFALDHRTDISPNIILLMIIASFDAVAVIACIYSIRKSRKVG